MTVSLATLRAMHPEFTDTPDAILTAAITAAGYHCDEEVWGDLYDTGVTLYACHLAAATPYGGGGRLDVKENQTCYLADWERLARAVGSMWRIL